MTVGRNIKGAATAFASVCLLALLPGVLRGSNPPGAAGLPQSSPVPGGVAIIPLDGKVLNGPPKVFYEEERVMTIKDGEFWYAIVGIPLDTDPGRHTLDIYRHDNTRARIRFKVVAKEYKTQYLTIKNKRKVNPNEGDLKRIREEQTVIDASFSRWRDAEEVSTRFSLPVEGRMSSPFGLRRFYNSQPRKPHSGMDIAAPKGTPVFAPADGKVIATGEFFFTGKTVFLDHGQGLVTMYCHMDHVDVRSGQVIKQHEIIGTVGTTGRATGPHLHWSVSLNNTRVNPALFIPEKLMARLR